MITPSSPPTPGSSPSPCQMPGCTNLADPGRLLCLDCRGGNVPVERKPEVVNLCGLNPDQVHESRSKRKMKRQAWNRLPRVTHTCACGCGRQFQVAQGGYYDGKRKYFNMECKKKHFRPNNAERSKWKLGPEFDDDLRRIYENEVEMYSPFLKHSPVRDLADKWSVPRWKVTRRAQELCLIPRRQKEPVWSEEELALLYRWAHCAPHTISQHLRESGFKRSAVSIAIKLTRIGARQLADAYSASEASKIFGIDTRTLIRWIERGYLAADRRGTNRTQAQGGDIWTITTDAIRGILRGYPEVVDFRKIDKYFIAQLL